MITEAQLKKTVVEYLENGATMGKWYFDRLNSGTLIADYNGKKRAIRMCRNGTADYFVLQNPNRHDVPFAYAFKSVRLIFIELKRLKAANRNQTRLLSKKR